MDEAQGHHGRRHRDVRVRPAGTESSPAHDGMRVASCRKGVSRQAPMSNGSPPSQADFDVVDLPRDGARDAGPVKPCVEFAELRVLPIQVPH